MPKLRNNPQESFTMRDADGEYVFANDSNRLSYIKNRVDRLFSKEPETIKWIKKIPEGSVFFDVGANIGVYTIYAAVSRNCRTFSFEPHSANYRNLVESVNLNKLKNSEVYPIAIGKELGLSSMFVHNLHAGVADNIVQSNGELYHGVITMNMDELISQGMLPQPDYIKIDVDGYEAMVYEGSREAIKNCKGLLIEVDQKHQRLVTDIQLLGLKLTEKHTRNTVEKNYIFTAV